jgi:hypothetical protein
MRVPDFATADELRKVMTKAEIKAKPSGAWVRLISRWAKLRKAFR